MAAIGDTTCDAILDEVFELINRAPDAALYIGLSQGDPLGDGSGLAEPSGGSYARVLATTAFGAAASGGSKTNDAAITFPLATGDWGTITHWFLANHATNVGAAIRWRGPLGKPKNVTAGDTFGFEIGDVTATLV